MAEHTIKIEDGHIRFVYDDDLADLVPEGYTCPIQRVSHVEPNAEGKWEADMQPAIKMAVQRGLDVQDAPVFLGPFNTRAEALLAEREWLAKYHGL